MVSVWVHFGSLACASHKLLASFVLDQRVLKASKIHWNSKRL